MYNAFEANNKMSRGVVSVNTFLYAVGIDMSYRFLSKYFKTSAYFYKIWENPNIKIYFNEHRQSKARLSRVTESLSRYGKGNINRNTKFSLFCPYDNRVP